MPEVSVVIKGQDDLTNVFQNVEEVGTKSFEAVETACDSASTAIDGMIAALERAQEGYDSQQQAAAEVGQSWAAAFGQSGEAMSEAMDAAEPSFAAAEAQFDALFQPLQNAEEEATKFGEAGAEAGGKAAAGATAAGVAAGGAALSWGKLALVAGMAGGAVEMMARQAAEANKNLDNTAIASGVSSEALRNVAVSATSAADNISESIAMMELAAQKGADSAPEFTKYVEFWDMVGDAAGRSGAELASASGGLKALGITLGNEGQALAAFGYMQAHTTIGVEGFLSSLQRSARALNEMKVPINDVAAVYGVLSSRGISGRQATMAFNQAVNEAKGDQEKFYKILGISSEQMEVYRGKVQESSDIIKKMSDNVDAHATLMQRLTNEMKKWTVQNGPLLESLAVISPVLLGIAGAIGAVSFAWPILAGAVTAGASALGISVGGFVAVSGAAIGTAAAIAALAIAWHYNIGNIQEYTMGTLIGMQAFVQSWAIKITGSIYSVVNYFGTAMSAGWKNGADAMGRALSAMLTAFVTFAGKIKDGLYNIAMAISEAFRGNFSEAASYASSAVSSFAGAVSATFQGAGQVANTFTTAWNSTWDSASAAFQGTQQDMRDELKNTAAAADDALTTLADSMATPSTAAAHAANAPAGGDGSGAGGSGAGAAGAATNAAAEAAVKSAWDIEQKQAEDLARQRAFEGQSKLDQLSAQYQAESALLVAHGQDTAATDLYYQQQIADERKRLRDADVAAQTLAMQNQAAVAGAFSQLMSDLYDAGGKKSMALFNLMKAGAIAEAIINANLAFTKALTMGPILGPIMAGIVFASAMVHVATIAAQKPPKMAAGGILTSPQTITAGEAGPEAIIPLDRLGLSSGGRTVVFNMNITGGVWTMDPGQARDFFRSNARYIKEAAAL